MKEALLRNRYGIPVALLLILLLCGTAIAWYCFATISSKTTVQEPLSANGSKEFDTTMYPGETNTWSFNIKNSALVVYTVKADLNFNAPSGVSISSFLVESFGEGGALLLSVDETGDLLDDGSAEFEVPVGGIICEMTISAAKDAAPGEVSVSLALSRG